MAKASPKARNYKVILQRSRIDGRKNYWCVVFFFLFFVFSQSNIGARVSQGTENIVVNNPGMTPVFLEPTVYPLMICATGENACLQLHGCLPVGPECWFR